MQSKKNKKSGFLLVNKPVGPTSFGVIAQLRRITGIKKIGHAGTLDPFASGVLVVAIGREATRIISQYVKLDKEYEALLHLGAVTNTYDRMGVVSELVISELGIDDIQKVLAKFRGQQKQIPPMFSAKKVGGKKLYELARKGIEVERKPVEINIYELELLDYNWPLLKIRVKCSSGTYIRSLAHEIGQALGCGAYLDELKRTAVGKFRIDECNSLKEISEDGWEKMLLVG